MAQCSFHLKKYDECIEQCTKYEKQYGQTDKCKELRTMARETHLRELRDERKRQNDYRKKGELLNRTIETLKERKIRFEEQLQSTPYEELIRPKYIPLEEYPIQMSEDGQLRWPAAFCYPEFEICDFQQQLYDSNVYVLAYYNDISSVSMPIGLKFIPIEKITPKMTQPRHPAFRMTVFFPIRRMYDILCDLFSERLAQDPLYKYKPDTVNVYYENRIAGTLHMVRPEKTIKEITMEKQ